MIDSFPSFMISLVSLTQLSISWGFSVGFEVETLADVVALFVSTVALACLCSWP